MDETDILTPSQKKLFKEQEMWMKDRNIEFSDDPTEDTRISAIYSIMERFPTEEIARKAVEYGGYPEVVDWYMRSDSKIIKKRYRSAKKSKSSVKCKCR